MTIVEQFRTQYKEQELHDGIHDSGTDICAFSEA